MFEVGDHIERWRVTGRLGRDLWRCRGPDDVVVRVTPSSAVPRAREWIGVSHPGLAPHLATGRLGPDRAFVVQQLVPGPTIAGVPPSPGDRFAGIERIASAIAHVHRAGLVHGAVRPSHVRWGPTGWVLVDPRMDDAPLDRSADVRGLAEVVYALFAGRSPVGGALDLRGLAPPPVRDWVLRAGAPRSPATAEALLSRLFDLQGSAAMFPRRPLDRRTPPPPDPTPPGPLPLSVAPAAAPALAPAPPGLGRTLLVAAVTALLVGSALVAAAGSVAVLLALR